MYNRYISTLKYNLKIFYFTLSTHGKIKLSGVRPGFAFNFRNYNVDKKCLKFKLFTINDISYTVKSYIKRTIIGTLTQIPKNVLRSYYKDIILIIVESMRVMLAIKIIKFYNILRTYVNYI